MTPYSCKALVMKTSEYTQEEYAPGISRSAPKPKNLTIYSSLFVLFVGVTMFMFGWFVQMYHAESLLSSKSPPHRRMTAIGLDGETFTNWSAKYWKWNAFLTCVSDYTTEAMALIITGAVLTTISTSYLVYAWGKRLLGLCFGVLLFQASIPVSVAICNIPNVNIATALGTTSTIPLLASFIFVAAIVGSKFPMMTTPMQEWGRAIISLSIISFSGFLLVSVFTYIIFTGECFASTQIVANYATLVVGTIILVISHIAYHKKNELR